MSRLTGVFCYACDQLYRFPEFPVKHEGGQRVCPSCSSDFLEEVASHDQTAPQDGTETSSAGNSAPQSNSGSAGLQQQQQPLLQQLPGFGLPHVQHHSFTTPGGHQLDLRVATTVMPVSADYQGDTYEGFMIQQDGQGDGGMSIDPLPILSQIMQSLQNFQPGQGGQPDMFGSGMRFLGGGSFNPGDFAGNRSFDQLLEQLADMHQPVFVPTAPATRDSLPRLQVPTPAVAAAAARAGSAVGEDCSNSSNGSAKQPARAACKAGDACTVCHDEYQAGAEVVQLECKHCFHEDCIMPWLETHSTCPVCRHQLPTDPNHRVQPSPADTAAAERLAGINSGELAPGPADFLQRLTAALQDGILGGGEGMQPQARDGGSTAGGQRRRPHAAAMRPGGDGSQSGRRVRRRTSRRHGEAALADLHHLFGGAPDAADQGTSPAASDGTDRSGSAALADMLHMFDEALASGIVAAATENGDPPAAAAASPLPAAATQHAAELPDPAAGRGQEQTMPQATSDSQAPHADAGVAQGFRLPFPGLGAIGSLFRSIWRR